MKEHLPSRTLQPRGLAASILIACLGGPVQAVASDAPPAATDGEPALEVLFHADVDGNLAQPTCDPRVPAPPDFGSLVGVIERTRAQAREAGAPAPLVLLGGNTIGPGLFARGLLKRDGDAGADLLGALLARGGYDAAALGHHDLALDRERLQRFLAALRARRIPVVAANLGCDRSRVPYCELLTDHVIVTRGGHRVAVTATISPLVLAGLSRASRDGLSLEPPLQALRRVAARARTAGAERILVLAQGPRGSEGLEELLGLQDALAGVPAVALVLAGGRGDGSAPPLRVLRRDDAPPVIGSTEDTASLARVRLPWHETAEPDITVLNTRGMLPDPAAAALLAPHLAQFCQRYGQPLGPGVVRGTITRQAWLSYVLAVMRRQARAEIALVNRDFVKASPFPLMGTLRRAQLWRAMPYHAVLGRARLTGAQILTSLAPALANPRLAALGLERMPGGAVTVNGRPVDRARSYVVASVPFLAQGGDEILPPDALALAPLRGEPDVRDLVESFLQTGTAAEDGDSSIDPDTDFGAPASARPLLVGLSDLSLDLGNTSVDYHPDYTVPQLTRARQRSIRAELSGVLQLRSRLHEADGRLAVVYGYSRNQPQGKLAVSGETADQIALSGLYNFRGLRGASRPRAWVPDPYARMLFESELTRPDPAVRDYHYAGLTATAGVIFTVVPKLRLRGGPGARKQLLAEGDPGRTRLLFEAGGTLDPIAVAQFGALTARLEAVFDYLFIDPTHTREHQLKGGARLSFPLLPLLYLTTGVDVFAMERDGLGWGAAYDTTIGLKIHLDAAHQSL